MGYWSIGLTDYDANGLGLELGVQYSPLVRLSDGLISVTDPCMGGLGACVKYHCL